MDKAELYVIVLWSNARYREDEILNDLKQQSNLKILEYYDIEWSPEHRASNYSRLYGTSINGGVKRITSRGNGNVLLITILDENPDYRFIETYSGHEYLNHNIYKLKARYREWTGGGYYIHASNNVKETKKNLVFFLGINYEDYLKNISEYTNDIKHIKRDFPGCNEWESLENMFYTLNEVSNYVILRNHEILPHDFKTDLHGDIDILTDDVKNTVYTLNATEYKTKNCIKYYVKVNGEKVKLDIRELGDNYYCYDFEKDMLETKIMNKDNIYTLNDEYYFYSLIYHALIQKKKISEDYYDKLFSLYQKIKTDKYLDIENYANPFDLYFIMLKDFMRSKNYYFVKPKDGAVGYNEAIINIEDEINWLNRHYGLQNIKTYNIQKCVKNRSSLYFEGYLNNNHVFIKTRCLKNVPKTEFKIMQTLYDKNNINFAKPYCYRAEYNIQNIIIEYLSGKSLEELYKENSVTPEIKKILLHDLEQIAHTLQDNKIIHCNIEPANLIFSNEAHFKLIDFKYAVPYNKNDKNDFMKKHYHSLKINWDFTYKRNVIDDFFSISKILTLFDLKSSYIDQNIGKMTITINEEKNIWGVILKNIFSVSNEYSDDHSKKYKVLKIAGLKFKSKRARNINCSQKG